MREVTYKCDSCGKQLSSQFLNNFLVTYYQGEPMTYDQMPNQFRNTWVKKYWKHKVCYQASICKDCTGTRIDHNYGDNNSGVSFDVMSFLKKLGFVKNTD